MSCSLGPRNDQCPIEVLHLLRIRKTTHVVVEHGLQHSIFKIDELSILLESLGESATLNVLGKYPTRTESVFHRFQINLSVRWTVGSLEIDLTFHWLLNNDHASFPLHSP